MSAGWGSGFSPRDHVIPGQNVALEAAEALSNRSNNALDTWGSHPSRVGDGGEQPGWVSEIKREPRRSCIVSTGSPRKAGSQHVQIGFGEDLGSKSGESRRSSIPECFQATMNRAMSHVKFARGRSRRSTFPRDSVLASIPTFDIRERMTPGTARELRRIYQLEEPVDEAVWSYLSWVARSEGVAMCVIALWTIWFSAFFVAFCRAYPFSQTLLYIDVVLDLIYLVGVGLELNISVIDRERRTEIQHRETIIDLHLRSVTFYFDILSCLISPFMFGESRRESAILLLMLAKYVRLHRTIWWPPCTDRIRRVPWFQVIWLIFILVTVNHLVGCVFFMVVEAQDLWERHVALLDPPVDEYAFSYAYGINFIHGQISKADILSPEELILYCIVAPFGTLISAMAFGEITVFYQRLNLLEGQHSDDMAFSTEAMRILRVPAEMQKRVDQYFRYVHSSRDTFALTKLMSSLNEPLLEELKLHLYKGLHCDPEFTKHVVMRLEDKIYSPGDYIIRAGQEGDCMFFIIKGYVEVLSAEGDVIMTKSGGDYFGELALLTVGTKRSATVKAKTFTALARLSAEHFDEVLVRFPHELRNAFRGFDLMAGEDLDSAFEQAQRRIHYRYRLIKGLDPPDLPEERIQGQE
ncbi:hypothetical protein, conserved [Eimeria maxima]|uniref:Cyclic nucleotide-binding domain-containing protein n=1 Tax=Eimeria maxima TaxID=5804 RepID=U6MFN4_EIMMA|nr:hypothetical protein, conserved [Eimeria maxima]CDJ61868.1 hypothetical protein, conserved [Eimeria maxima]